MKKVLLLGALLSTMAFGTAPEGAKPATAEVSLTGTAVPVLEIVEGGDFVFGEVVIKTTKKLSQTFKIKGATGHTVKLDANLSGKVITEGENILMVGIGEDGVAETTSKTGISTTPTGTETTIYVTYAPTDVSHTLTNEKLLLTATYE